MQECSALKAEVEKLLEEVTALQRLLCEEERSKDLLRQTCSGVREQWHATVERAEELQASLNGKGLVTS